MDEFCRYQAAGFMLDGDLFFHLFERGCIISLWGVPGLAADLTALKWSRTNRLKPDGARCLAGVPSA